MKKNLKIKLELPEKLVQDIRYVSKVLNMTSDEWLKARITHMIMKMSKDVYELKSNFIEKTEDFYVRNIISEEDFIKRKGHAPSKELKNRRKIYKTRYLSENSKKYVVNYLVQMIEKSLRSDFYEKR